MSGFLMFLCAAVLIAAVYLWVTAWASWAEDDEPESEDDDITGATT